MMRCMWLSIATLWPRLSLVWRQIVMDKMMYLSLCKHHPMRYFSKFFPLFISLMFYKWFSCLLLRNISKRFCHHITSQVFVIMMRLLSVMMSKSQCAYDDSEKPESGSTAETSEKTEHSPESSGKFHSTTASILTREKLVDLCHHMLRYVLRL